MEGRCSGFFFNTILIQLLNARLGVRLEGAYVSNEGGSPWQVRMIVSIGSQRAYGGKPLYSSSAVIPSDQMSAYGMI